MPGETNIVPQLQTINFDDAPTPNSSANAPVDANVSPSNDDTWSKAFGSEVNNFDRTDPGEAQDDVGMFREPTKHVSEESSGLQPEPIQSFDKLALPHEAFDETDGNPALDFPQDFQP